MLPVNKEKYSDIDMDLRRNPITGDIIRLTTEQSIAQSVKNLVLIHFYEKHFNPQIGNFAPGAMFENLEDTNILRSVRRSIERIITRWEPRVKVNRVTITDQEAVDQNRIAVKIEYTIIGKIGESTVEFFLRRIR